MRGAGGKALGTRKLRGTWGRAKTAVKENTLIEQSVAYATFSLGNKLEQV